MLLRVWEGRAFPSSAAVCLGSVLGAAARAKAGSGPSPGSAVSGQALPGAQGGAHGGAVPGFHACRRVAGGASKASTSEDTWCPRLGTLPGSLPPKRP